MSERPFTPAQLAQRWHCSAETVRTLFKTGRLQGFWLGRQIRIPAASVQEFEACPTTASSAFVAVSPSSSTTRTASAAGIVLRHSPERKRKPRPVI
ncbi:helix-turn-helix domain-containing protein [Roseivivax marinus]|uniref:helix-turn-helix domain-containing protein n=1 Tax=Roseivivax marinus TaxID=1379903 RepID=UPI003B9759A9